MRLWMVYKDKRNKVYILIRKKCNGTLEYMAPELLRNRDYDYTVDIWSLGVLLYELLHGFSPFKGTSETYTFGNILQCNYTFRKGISIEAQDLIRGLLQKIPKSRLTWDKIFSHKWITKFQAEFNIKKNIPIENEFQEFTFDKVLGTLSKVKIPYSMTISTIARPKNLLKSSAKFATNSACETNTSDCSKSKGSNETNETTAKAQKLAINDSHGCRAYYKNLIGSEMNECKCIENTLCYATNMNKKGSVLQISKKPTTMYIKSLFG